MRYQPGKRLKAVFIRLIDGYIFASAVVSLILLSTSSAAFAAPGLDAPTLRLLQVEEFVYLGIIPRGTELSEAPHDFGVVVDLRYPYEGAYTELAKLRTTPISYVNIPTSSSSPSPANVGALEKVIADYPTRKLLIHDSNGHRSAVLWAAHLVHVGESEEQAVARIDAFFAADQARKHLARYVQKSGIKDSGRPTPQPTSPSNEH